MRLSPNGSPVRFLRTSRFSLLVILAMCALVSRFTTHPGLPIDSNRLLVGGVRIGMTGEEVIHVHGHPHKQSHSESGTVDWSYGDLTVALKTDAGGEQRVVFAGASQLDTGSVSLELGSSESQTRRALASLGAPKLLDLDHHCGEWFPSLEDGSLHYPGGLEVWFSRGRVWRFSLAQDGAGRFLWPTN